MIGCQSPNRNEAYRFKTFTFDLNEADESMEFAKWKEKHLNDQPQIEPNILFTQDSTPVGSLYYSDDEYQVYGYCFGEFGGALLFQDAILKDSIYYLESTCPVMIDRRADGFYITSSSTHSGSAKIQFFESPKELINVPLDSLNGNWKEKRWPQLSNYEIALKLGNQGQILVDTAGLSFNLCFQFEDQNFLIYSNSKSTFLGKVTSGSIQLIDLLMRKPSWGYNYDPTDKINGFFHYNFDQGTGFSLRNPFQQEPSQGDIYVRNDTIVISHK